MEKYESKEYSRTRKAYLFQALFEYLITLMVTDAFLSKVLISVGASDALAGIVASFVSLTFLVQLLLVFINDKIKNTKRTVLVFSTLSQVLFMLVYLIPFLPAEKSVKVIIVVICVLIAYFVRYLVEPVLYRWANSFVSPRVLAEYTAKKEILSLIGGMIFSLAVGMIVDRFEAGGNLMSGFLFIAVTILINNILNFICIFLIKNEKKEEAVKSTGGIKEIFRQTMKNKKFCSVLFFVGFAQFGTYITFGFLGTFKINDLMMSLSMIQIINIIACSIRAFISVPFGKFSDKYGYARGMELGYIIMAVAFLMNAFCNQSSWWLIIAFTVLYNVGNAGVGANGINITFLCVPKDYFVPAMAINQSIKGVCGFLGSLVGGAMLSYIQSNGNSFLGFNVYGQQVLSVISFIILIGVVLYDKLVVEKLIAPVEENAI